MRKAGLAAPLGGRAFPGPRPQRARAVTALVVRALASGSGNPGDSASQSGRQGGSPGPGVGRTRGRTRWAPRSRCPRHRPGTGAGRETEAAPAKVGLGGRLAALQTGLRPHLPIRPQGLSAAQPVSWSGKK